MAAISVPQTAEAFFTHLLLFSLRHKDKRAERILQHLDGEHIPYDRRYFKVVPLGGIELHDGTKIKASTFGLRWLPLLVPKVGALRARNAKLTAMALNKHNANPPANDDVEKFSEEE